jgi:cytochrome c553
MGYRLVVFLSAVVFAAGVAFAGEELEPVKPRVPKEDMGKAKAMKNPVEATPANIAKGKELFENKGTCINCHGKEGNGEGPAAAALPIKPRNFTNCKFHKKRTDGEMFWVIKNGSKGPNDAPRDTPMVALIPSAITEEEAWTIINYERTFCKKGE